MISIRRKFAQDLVVADVVVAIAGITEPPSLHRDSDGRTVVSYKQVTKIEESIEEAPIFDPLDQKQEGANVGIGAITAAVVAAHREGKDLDGPDLQRAVLESINASPNAGKDLLEVTITCAGCENGQLLEQMPVEHRLRALDIVDVVEGNLAELWQPAQETAA